MIHETWNGPITEEFKHEDLGISDLLKTEIENGVIDWLNNKATSDLMVSLTDRNGEISDTLTFTRALVNLKTALNEWDVYHIATCPRWPRILSSNIKNRITRNAFCGEVLPNEIKSSSYNQEFMRWTTGSSHKSEQPETLSIPRESYTRYSALDPNSWYS